jgi:DNA-binding CsgD family transcriptional regulator
MTNKEIGVAMGCSEGTAKNHLVGAYDRIGVHTRVEAALLASRWGLPS